MQCFIGQAVSGYRGQSATNIRKTADRLESLRGNKERATETNIRYYIAVRDFRGLRGPLKCFLGVLRGPPENGFRGFKGPPENGF